MTQVKTTIKPPTVQAPVQVAESATQTQSEIPKPKPTLESILLSGLPQYRALSIDQRLRRGGFYGNRFEVDGLPATIEHCFWPRDQLHEARDIWRPIDPELVTKHESELAGGKIFIRQGYEVIDGMVCTGKERSDLVMLVATKEARELKTQKTNDAWNDRFERALPEGQSNGPLATDSGRGLLVDRARDSQVQVATQLLESPQE